MRLVKLGLIMLAIALALFAAKQTRVPEIITNAENLQAWIASFGHWGYVVFTLTYILAGLFLLPGSALTITAGIVFGSVKGGMLALVSATLGAVIAFMLARFLLRDSIIGKFGNSPIFRKIDQGVAKNGTSFLILTRLIPIFPFGMQNYAYGLTGIRLSTYAFVSMLTMTPSTFIYAYMANDIANNGVSAMLLLKLASAGLVLFGLSLIPKYIAKKKSIDMAELAK